MFQLGQCRRFRSPESKNDEDEKKPTMVFCDREFDMLAGDLKVQYKLRSLIFESSDAEDLVPLTRAPFPEEVHLPPNGNEGGEPKPDTATDIKKRRAMCRHILA